MTIEIHIPELEALIRERMKRGAFQSVEDALLQALKSSPLPAEQDAGFSNTTPGPTGADLVAAIQASPYKEIDLEPTRARPCVMLCSDGLAARYECLVGTASGKT